MQAADMAIIKEIPGYQVIMKAVLKNQIQQLVEQLSETTGEESILLTASVSDGTLSHLGSESGKSFLDGHEDVKSQFLGYVLKRHHTKKSEKQFASSPARKFATQQSLNESGATLSEASSHTESQQNFMPQLSMAPTPIRYAGKKKGRPRRSAAEPSPVIARPKRSAAAMKSPFKSDIYVDENDEEVEVSDGGLEQSENTATAVTEEGLEDTAVKYTSVKSVVPVSGPIPVVPKLETENLYGTQEQDNSNISAADRSEAVGEISDFENIVVKKEVLSDVEMGTDMEEKDPDWEPGAKKRRKSSGSLSVTSPVNVASDQPQIIVEKTRLSSAEKQRRYRNRRDSDPVKRQLYLQKLKAKYQENVQAGKTKLVKNMTATEHRIKQEKWRFSKQKERKSSKEDWEKMFEHRTQELDPKIESRNNTSLETYGKIKSELDVKNDFNHV